MLMDDDDDAYNYNQRHTLTKILRKLCNILTMIFIVSRVNFGNLEKRDSLHRLPLSRMVYDIAMSYYHAVDYSHYSPLTYLPTMNGVAMVIILNNQMKISNQL